MLKVRLYLWFVCAFLSLNVSGSTLEEQILFVDKQIEGTIQNQIDQIYKYTLECINKKGGIYLDVQNFMKTKDNTPFINNRNFIIILGGLYALDKLHKIENPTYVTIDKIGEVSAALLSSKLFTQNYKYHYKNNYSIYKGCLRQIENLKEFGLLALNEYDVLEKLENKEQIKNKIYEEPLYHLPLKYFKPIIMMQEDAIYRVETYIYALSKGCLLFGLTDTQNDAHGGLFCNPIEIYVHDQGHYNELLSPNLKCINDTYSNTASCLVHIASLFYQYICIDKIFGELDVNYKRAILAAFLLLHENAIGCIALDESCSLIIILQTLEAKIINTLEYYLKNLVTYKGYVFGFVSPKFDILLASSFATDLVQVFPELKKELYGNEKNDIELKFHPKNTLKYNLDNIKWFLRNIRSALQIH